MDGGPQTQDWGAGSPEWAPLLEAAWAARERAHAPYSGFRVGAALLLDDGSISPGCNVENASYPVGLCAERAALAAAVAVHGARPGRLRAIAIVAEAPEPVAPCGACRQALVEFALAAPGTGCPGLPLLLANRAARRLRRLEDLLPDAFGL